MKNLLSGSVAFYALALLWTPSDLATGQTNPNSPSARYAGFIAAAGNAELDEVRLEHLRKLAHQCKGDQVTMEGLDGLLRFIERWVSPEARLDFFSRPILQTQDYDLGVGESSPLIPIAAFYRARMLVWATLEYSDIYPFPQKRAAYLGKARQLFEVVRRAFPENRIARMYLGEPIPSAQRYDAPAGAPSWAVWQREALERLTDIIEWWIDHRLRPNGEYGGGWGDDCEMWRHWTPVLIGFDHPKVNWAQSYFSERLLAQRHLAGGYHSQMTDVEHSAEDFSDALTPMMFVDPQNPEWAKRARRLVELMENLWTGRNERGFLQFKSTYFTVDRVDLSPARSCDTVYHPRALQPALLYWQRTGDSRMTGLFSDWMKTWAEAATRGERGKPPGILPTAIHWPDGQAGGVGERWWQPENYSTPLYDFPSAMSMMLNTLLLTYHMTGDRSFLEPIRSMAVARIDWLKAGRPDAAPGSRLWCAAQLGLLGQTLAKYRLLTDDESLDDLLRREDLPYVRVRLQNDLEGLAAGLRQIASVLRVNFPAYTQEVRYTDRVFRFPVLYEPGFMFKEGTPSPMLSIERSVLANGLNRLSLLYSTVTGDPGDPLYFPMNAVRWKTSPRNLAALVTDSGRHRFVARLYHFGSADRRFEAELFLLDPGAYAFSLAEASGGRILESGRFQFGDANRSLSLTLASGVECILRIQRSP
ncbi:MAG: hypothetical protein HY735_35200 [Verrucomicrobia bacterium]|nr:hypothetical protein [Verrucomicrobiota bacterium]